VVVAGDPARVVKTLDPNAPRVTRMDLYRDPEALRAFFEDAWLKEHGGNTLLGWLRAKIAPRRGD
jgi:hypothetical protein